MYSVLLCSLFLLILVENGAAYDMSKPPDASVLEDSGVTVTYIDHCKPIEKRRPDMTFGKVAFDKCLEYQESLVYPCAQDAPAWSADGQVVVRRGIKSRCRRAKTRVKGVHKANEGQFSQLAILGYGDESALSWGECMGTVISERVIITTASCLTLERNGQTEWVSAVRLGVLRASDPWDPAHVYALDRPSGAAPADPDHGHRVYDVALLWTAREIVFGTAVVPACLDVFPEDLEFWAKTFSWGKKTQGAPDGSDHLHFTTVEKVPSEQCYGLWHTAPRLRDYRYLATNLSQACYGDRGVDACTSQPGSPILAEMSSVRCMHRVTALYAGDCAGGVGLYTDLRPFVGFVEAHAWPQLVDQAPGGDAQQGHGDESPQKYDDNFLKNEVKNSVTSKDSAGNKDLADDKESADKDSADKDSADKDSAENKDSADTPQQPPYSLFSVNCSGAPLDADTPDPATHPHPDTLVTYSTVELVDCAPPTNGSIASALNKLKVQIGETLILSHLPPNTELSAPSFAGLKHSLQSLRISAVPGAAKLKQKALTRLHSLTALEISGVSAVAVPKHLQRVEILGVGLPDGALDAVLLTVEDSHLTSLAGQAPHLETLWVSAPLQTLPSAPSLSSLSLRSLPAHLPANFLRGCPALKKLTIDQSDLETLPDGFFKYTKNLFVIDLRNNKLESLPRNIFSGLRFLTGLWLGNNRLHARDVIEVAPLTSLTSLHLSDNPLGDLCPPGGSSPLANLSELTLLALSRTNATRLCRDWLLSLRKLACLSLSDNGIRSLSCADLRASRDQLKDPFINLVGNPIARVHCTRRDFDTMSTEPEPEQKVSIFTYSKLACDCDGFWFTEVLQERSRSVDLQLQFQRESCLPEWSECDAE